jgi:hypothetical protein
MPQIHQKSRNFIFSQWRLFKLIIIFPILMLLAGCNVASWRWLTDRGVSESLEQDGLRLTMSSPRFRYEPGETVTISVVLENTTGKPVLLKSMNTTEYAFDINIDDQLLLSSVYPELQVFERELAPGEKIEINYGYVPDSAETGGNVKAYFSYLNKGISGVSKIMSVSYGSVPIQP